MTKQYTFADYSFPYLACVLSNIHRGHKLDTLFFPLSAVAIRTAHLFVDFARFGGYLYIYILCRGWHEGERRSMYISIGAPAGERARFQGDVFKMAFAGFWRSRRMLCGDDELFFFSFPALYSQVYIWRTSVKVIPDMVCLIGLRVVFFFLPSVCLRWRSNEFICTRFSLWSRLINQDVSVVILKVKICVLVKITFGRVVDTLRGKSLTLIVPADSSNR